MVSGALLDSRLEAPDKEKPDKKLYFYGILNPTVESTAKEILNIKGPRILNVDVQKSQRIPTLKPYYLGLTLWSWLKTSSALVFPHGKERASHVANANFPWLMWCCTFSLMTHTLFWLGKNIFVLTWYVLQAFFFQLGSPLKLYSGREEISYRLPHRDNEACIGPMPKRKEKQNHLQSTFTCYHETHVRGSSHLTIDGYAMLAQSNLTVDCSSTQHLSLQ